MIEKKELKRIARARLKDAIILFEQKRYDGSIYLCGYSIELALKYRICKTLRWDSFPETHNDFKKYGTFKTHDLEVLLHISGIESKIKKENFSDWSIVSNWNPERRYQTIGKTDKLEAERMIFATEILLKKL